MLIFRIVTKKSGIELIALAYFQLFRSFVIQYIITYPFIKKTIIGKPLIGSLFVSYEPTDDYYYSGHVGTTLAITITFFRNSKLTSKT